MMEQLSLYTYILTFISLSLWFLNKNHNELRLVFGKLFLASFSCYSLLFVLMPSAQISYIEFTTQLLFLFFGGFFLNTFSANKFVFLPLMTLFVCGIFVGQNDFKIPYFSAVLDQNLQAANPDNELLLELKEGHVPTELQSLINQYQLKLKPAFFPKETDNTDLDDYYLVDIPKDQLINYPSLLKSLENHQLVDHVEVNEIIKLDPFESEESPAMDGTQNAYANDPEIGKLWGFEAMQVESLYARLEKEKIKPKKKAKIAIIDTGVDGYHEDIKGNFESVGARHNIDEQGHGTHCAGIAAAVSNNRIGIASFAPNQAFVTVTSVKVFGKFGSTTQKKIIEGMLLAVDNGADVLSMSLGGPATGKARRAYRQAVKYAQNKGAIVVVAAGNENTDAARKVPASVDGVITVSAIDNQIKKASFSNYVSNVKMGIAAPGVQIYSSIPANKYAFYNGTSMATPYVAGLLGLMKSIRPELDTKEAYRILKASGKSTNEDELTGKLIQPAAALNVLLKK